MKEESNLREEICCVGASLFDRGLTCGASGNMSAQLSDTLQMTPTGSSLGRLDPARLSCFNAADNHVDDDAPTREAALHAAFYERRRAWAGAVVNLHPTHSVVLPMLPATDSANMLSPLIACSVMRLGRVQRLPCFMRGDPAMADAVRAIGGHRSAIALANHGLVVAGRTLDASASAIEELEEGAKLALMTRGAESGAAHRCPDRAHRRETPAGLGLRTMRFSANRGFLRADAQRREAAEKSRHSEVSPHHANCVDGPPGI